MNIKFIGKLVLDPSGAFFDAQEKVEDGADTPMDANCAANAEAQNSVSNTSMTTAVTTFEGAEAQGF